MISQTVPDNDCVICPKCAWQFRAIPVNVQAQLRETEAARIWNHVVDEELKIGRPDPGLATPVVQGEPVAPIKCALCGDKARIPPVCDACHDSMGTRATPAPSPKEPT